MKIFAIGDPHLSFDPSVDKPMDIFGGGWENHTEKLNKYWRESITSDDVVLIAGDISWGLTLEQAEADLNWLRGLPGQKLLFKGNHDLWWQSLKKLKELYHTEEGEPDPDFRFMQNEAVLLYGPKRPDGTCCKVAVCGSRGWTCPGDAEFTAHDRRIYEREVIRMGMRLAAAEKLGADRIIAVMHYPPTNDKHQPSDFTGLFEKYGVSTVVYGHLHTKDGYRRGFQGVLNGVEYKLVSLDYLDGKPKEVFSWEEK